MPTVLESLAQTLLRAEIDLQFVPQGYEDSTFDQIFIGLDENTDKEELDFVLQLFRPQEIMISQGQEELAKDGFPFDTLTLHAPLEVLINRNRIHETYQMMAFFNQLLPMGNFDFNSFEGQMYYSYNLMSDQKTPDPLLVASAIDKLEYFIPLMGKKLMELHESEKTLVELVNELTDDFEKVKNDTIAELEKI